MSKTLIIGYGNPLRGDDGLGWRAAEQLGAMLPGRQARIMTCHQLTPDLAEPISRAELIVFIDAEVGEPAGKVFCRRVKPAARLSALSHHLTPAALLDGAQELYGSRCAAVILSVSGQDFSCTEELSPAVAATLPRLTARVCRLVRRWEKRRSMIPNEAQATEPSYA